MAPAKVDDDSVIAEYDVFLTPPINEQLYLLQYPNRPRTRPYSLRFGSSPQDMRIKPNSGFLEMEVGLNTEQNFNKYMGLKWGDADRAARELQNASGTYGPAAGLAWSVKPRALNRAAMKDQNDRELEYQNDLTDFKEAEKQGRVHSKQTLGGQIIRHDAKEELGKPQYFVGAFHNDQLHLTMITGTVQMRPHFHHLDAEEQRARIAVSRAQAESGGPQPESIARTLTSQFRSKQEQETVESRLNKGLKAAAQEPWLQIVYTDEDALEAYEQFEQKLKVQDTDNLPHLKSDMDNDKYLDAIGAPRHNSPTRRRKRPPRTKDAVNAEGDEVHEVVEPSADISAG